MFKDVVHAAVEHSPSHYEYTKLQELYSVTVNQNMAVW